jgi:prephenate dehydrogenase
MVVNKISIIGLGLIGSSLARAFRSSIPGVRIFALDNCSNSLIQAELDNVIDIGDLVPFDELWDADVLFICTPVKETTGFIDLAVKNLKSGAILTDVSSTKSNICEYVAGLKNAPQFIGGHPMAGTENSGYLNGFSHLFENAYYALTPISSTSAETISVMQGLLKGIGAIPITITAEEHDFVAGCISHIPHIIASGLVNLVRLNETKGGMMQLLAAGGFKDITRIASSNPKMWENVVLSNKSKIQDLLEKYKAILYEFSHYLDKNSSPDIIEYFSRAKNFRDEFSQAPKGLIPKNFELIVDVSDEPGIIGKIATLLGVNGINIKNINVSNSREFEKGCLRLTLSDQLNTDKAFNILSRAFYSVYKNE